MTCLLRLVGIASVFLNNDREWSGYYATINVDGASELTVEGRVGISCVAVEFEQPLATLDRYVLRGNGYGVVVPPLRARRYEVHDSVLESIAGASGAEYLFSGVEGACLKTAHHVRAQWKQSSGSILLERVSTEEFARLRQRALPRNGLDESRYNYVQVIGGIERAGRCPRSRPTVTMFRSDNRACKSKTVCSACRSKTARVNTQRFFQARAPKGNDDGSVVCVDILTWQRSPEIVRSSTPFNIAVFEPCVFDKHIDTLDDYLTGLLKTDNAGMYRVKVGELATFAFQNISEIGNEYLTEDNWRQYYAMQCPLSGVEFTTITLQPDETYTSSGRIVCNFASSRLSDVFDMEWSSQSGTARYDTRCVNIGKHYLTFRARQLATLVVSVQKHPYPLTMIDISPSKARWRSSGMCSAYVITDALANITGSCPITYVQDLRDVKVGLVEWAYAPDQRLEYAGGTGCAEIAQYAIPEVGNP